MVIGKWLIHPGECRGAQEVVLGEVRPPSAMTFGNAAKAGLEHARREAAAAV
jgi:hypothetical protein